MPRSRRILVGAAVAFTVLLVAGVVGLAFGGNGARQHASTGTATPRSQNASPGPSLVGSGLHPVAPATTIPAQTPVQQQYDQRFAQGYASTTSRAMLAKAEALHVPDPAIGGGWPNLPASNTPGGWAREFVHGLLDINFAHQSRSALGAWLIAQEAPDLMPGIPAGFQKRALYVSVMDPATMGQAALVPSAAQWQADVLTGVRWSVHGLQVQLDPAWQSMIAAGWQPRDLRASVEDVSGVLTVVHGKTATTRRISLTVTVGSARWHHGYGTVAVTVRGG